MGKEQLVRNLWRSNEKDNLFGTIFQVLKTLVLTLELSF